MDPSGLQICNFLMERPYKNKLQKVQKNLQMHSKGDYAHFTLKEISEQPDTMSTVGKNTQEALHNEKVTDQIKQSKNNLHYW